MSKLMACLLGGLLFFSMGCDKDDKNDPVGCNWFTEVQAESTALSDAATAYGLDPTTANCEAFVDAYEAYLVALEANLGCAGTQGNQAELQAEIDAAQAQLANINC